MINFDCGIYSITSPSGKQYIGQAISFQRRWRGHIKELKAGRHHCDALQNAFRKYGLDRLVFAKIAFVPPEQLNIAEQEQIDSRRRNLLYNTAMTASASMRGRSHSRKVKAQISASMMGRRLGGSNPRARAVICIETGIQFETGTDAAKWLRQNGRPKADPSTISKVCNGKFPTAYGYTWRHADRKIP